MSCDHQFIGENLSDFLEGKLAPSLEARARDIIAGCPQCAATCDKARELYRLGDAWQDRPVPAWNRARFAVKPPQRQVYWVNWAAMAMSCLAVILVVFRLEVSTADGLTISFGGGQSERHLQEAVSAALAQYSEEQQALLTARLTEFSEDQAVANQLMFSQWSDTARRDRRDDIDFVMSAWETQRFQDQRQINRRFDTLASNQIESDQFINDLARNVNFRQ